MQRQPASKASEQSKRPQSANRPQQQNSGRDSRDQQADPASHAGHAVQPSSSTGTASNEQNAHGQMLGSFNGGQTGAGQLPAALGSGALLQSMGGMPYPGQGEHS